MRTIKHTVIAFATLILLTIGVFVLSDAMSHHAKAAPPQRGGVVVLVARPEVSISPQDLVVVFSSNSQSAPSVSRNASLAQVLDDLLANGFQIQHIEDTSIGLNYTLVR